MSKSARVDVPLMLIAGFKLLKAILLITAAVVALRLVHHDVGQVVTRWIRKIHLNPEQKYISSALARVTGLTDQRLRALGIGLLLYSGLFITEGVGLILRKRWAEYLTVISTSLLLPLEIYELVRRFTTARVLILLANLVVVAYLILRLRRERPGLKKTTGPAKQAPLVRS